MVLGGERAAKVVVDGLARVAAGVPLREQERERDRDRENERLATVREGREARRASRRASWDRRSRNFSGSHVLEERRTFFLLAATPEGAHR